MNEITINIDDYIDEDEKRELCRQAFMAVAERKAKDDLERIISNAAFAVVFKAVDAAMDGKAMEMIRAKVIERIEKIGNYEIFRKADAWDRSRGAGDSAGQIAIEAAVKENSEILRERVKDILRTIDGEKLADQIHNLVYEVIQDRIIGKQVAP